MPFSMWFKWYKHEKYFDLFTHQANSWGDAILGLPPSVSYSNDTLWNAFNTKRNCRWHFKPVREKQSANFQSCKRVRWEFSCVTCKSSHRCKESHNYQIFTPSSLIPSFSEEPELQKPSSEEYQIQGLLTWPWVVSQLKLKKFYRNMSTYCLKVPEVNISVMKFTFFVLVSTHELCNLMMFLCFSVFNKWTSD